MSRSPSRYKTAGLVLSFVWFFGGGIGHFVANGFFAGIVPPYIPFDPHTVVYVSGASELLGALALLSPRWRSLAGWWLIGIIVCVSPANVWMWQHPELYPKFPPVLLLARLPLQVLLILCVWWSTRREAGAPMTTFARTF